MERTDPRRQGIFPSAKTPEGTPVAPWLRYLKEGCQKPLLSLVPAIALEAVCVERVFIAIQGHLHDVTGLLSVRYIIQASHFTDKKTEAQRAQLICPNTHN